MATTFAALPLFICARSLYKKYSSQAQGLYDGAASATGDSFRILRKAETVLSHRTSRIVLVIERCSSSHNYTAVLRTAEALGIQHVFLIQPPVKDAQALVDKEKASTIDNGCGQEFKYDSDGDLVEVIDKTSTRKSWKRRKEVWVTDKEEQKKVSER
mgnify:CR=1 FL=1|tara:strand:- start:417 stop:887 length:471 start_codon:yes stop_codon:yes gene_type:complete